MQPYRLTRLGNLTLILLALLALGATTAATAQAEEAPFWSIKGTRLAAGETHFVTGKSYKEVSISSQGITIKCPTVTIKEGVLVGSNAGEPGTAGGVIEFAGGCTVTGNGTGCKVEEPIVTRPVILELVESEKGEKGSLLVEGFARKGATLTTVKYTGTCTTRESTLEGSLVGQVFTDPNKPPELGELVKLPNTKKEGTSWLVNFPETPIQKVWLIKAGVGSEVSVGLTSATEPATAAGTLLGLLANSKRESVEERWSPLP